jgi:hypothetical protein
MEDDLMNKIFEIARAFYGVLIPERKRKNFSKLVFFYLDRRYSIETAIGLALKRLKLTS